MKPRIYMDGDRWALDFNAKIYGDTLYGFKSWGEAVEMLRWLYHYGMIEARRKRGEGTK